MSSTIKKKPKWVGKREEEAGTWTHSIIRVEDVWGRGIIQDEGPVQVPAQAAQVFHVAALVEHAGFAEQPSPKHAALIQQVRHWVRILEKEGQERGRARTH